MNEPVYSSLKLWILPSAAVVLFLAALITSIKKHDYRNFIFGCIFVIGGIGSWAAMIVSPDFPPRTLFPGVFFISIGILFFIDTVLKVIKKPKTATVICILISLSVCLCLVWPALTLTRQYKDLNIQMKNRMDLIEELHAKGERDIVLPALLLQPNTHLYMGIDITEDENYYCNKSFATYYGFDSARIEKE